MAANKPTTTKKKGEPAQGVVIQNITIRPVVRSSQDIQKWRSALQSAEGINPVRVPLYDLYDDLLMDAVLSSLVDKRILGVTKTKLVFLTESGEEVPEINDLIALSQFRELRRELMLRKFWGITVCELMVINSMFRVFSVPRKHIRPDIGKIVYEQHGIDGIDYRLPPCNKYIIEAGKSDDLGLLLKAAPYVIYKRGGFGDWAHFAEVFGMPFREARYDGFNQAVRAQLELALEQAGSASYAILPKEAEITFHEAKSTQGSGELYNLLRKACNEELSILILGQTETTASSSSSGYAQSKTHAEVESAINLNDREDELSILNETVKPVLATLGYKVGNGRFQHVPAEEQLGLKEKAEVIVKMKTQVGLPIDDDWLYNEFGIEKPANYDAIKQQQEEQRQAAAGAAANGGKGDDQKLSSLIDERLKSFFS